MKIINLHFRISINVKSILSKGLLLLFLLGITTLANAQFTANRIVVLKTSGTSVTAQASPVTIQEYGTDGTSGYAVTLPSTGSTPIQLAAGYSGSEGLLTQSPDNTYLLLAGFSLTGTNTSIAGTSSTTTPRIIGKVDYSGAYTQLYASSVNYNANDIRGAITDGSNFWASGASAKLVSGVGDGVDYFGPGTPVALGKDATNPVKAYGLHIFNNQIYYSTQKAGPSNTATALGVFSLGSGLQTAGTAVSTQIINTGSVVPEDFSFNSSMNICYITINSNTATGGIQKWTKSGSAWSLAYTLGTGVTNIGAYSLVVDYSGSNPVIYATTFEADANRIIKITDTGSASTSSTIATAATGSWFHGICFSPKSICTTPLQPSTFTVSSTSVNQGQTAVVYSVANDATASSYSWTYSGTGAVITGTSNSVSIDFSSTATSGTLTVAATSGCGTSIARTLDITVVPANNPPTIAIDVANTTDYLDSGVSLSPASPYAISGVLNDPTDPAQTLGIAFALNDVETAANNLTVTAASSNTAVVPNENLNLTGTGASRNLKITPVGIGYSTITIKVSDGVNNTSYGIKYAASAPSTTPATTFWHTGISNASDAIALDDNYYMTGDDEFDVINVYSRSASGLPLVSYNYNAVSTNLNLSTSFKPEADVEAATRSTSVANRIYWLGSMSNNSSFVVEPNRDRLFATTYTGAGASIVFSFAGYCSLRSQILAWGDANGYNFTSSAAAGSDPKTTSGFNAEGMVFAPDNSTMYIGLRAPLVPTATRTNAVIVPVLNFESWFNADATNGTQTNATFGSPIELNLGGRGIRDLIRLSNGTYIILAGSCGSDQTSAIFKWTGSATNAPVLVNSSANGVLNIEGVMQMNNAGNISLNQLQLISDNGDDDFYNDGSEAKALGDLNFQKFRSDIVNADLSLITTGLNESATDQAAFQLLPNPVKDNVQVTLPKNYQLSNISVYNTAGEKVKSVNSTASQLNLSVSELKAGVYLVVMTGVNGNQTVKHMVKF